MSEQDTKHVKDSDEKEEEKNEVKEGQNETKEEEKQNKKENKTKGNKDKKKKKKPEWDNDVTDDSNEGRSKQKQFFKEELKRLEDSLKQEKSKIQKPALKKNIPYVFNNLAPYFSTRTAKFLIELPEEMTHAFTSRETAQGLCDPVDDYKMNELPQLAPAESKAINRHQKMNKQEKKIKERETRHGTHEGSTRLPRFPVVSMETNYATRDLYYSDVPMLRQELEDKYSTNAKSKVDEDYKRTQDDFYRMELDRMSEYHPSNRPLMRQAYFAYLSNTPGSRKAIHEIMKENKEAAKAQ